MTTTLPGALHSDIDLFADDVLENPYPAFKQLRDLGPAAWLSQYDVGFIGRYEQTRAALADWKTFSSGQGIGLNPTINKLWEHALINVDPPVHTETRKLFSERLGPKHLKAIEDTIDKQANHCVEQLLARGSFDAVKELAQDLPINVVMDLIGWPQHVRAQLLELADGSFDPCGPENERMRTAMPRLDLIIQLIEQVYNEGSLTPGGFGATVADAARRGDIPVAAAIGLLQGYVVAAFDTTVSAIASGMWLFATHPQQWDLLRATPTLIPRAFNEILRMESPIQHFSRVTTRDVDLGDGTVIPNGTRMIVSYASANRDERQFADPDRFDIARPASPHLAFGLGVHSCAGQNLARLEAHAVFTALARRVRRFELAGDTQRRLYNVTRSFSRVPVRMVAD